jgi:hypothetical protein
MPLPDKVSWAKIYWVRGALPRGSMYSPDVSDPPCSGWQHAFILHGEKRSTIFCPHTFMGFTVRNTASELTASIDRSASFNEKAILDTMDRNWKAFQGYGWQRDYDTAALILRKFKVPVPDQIARGGEEDTKTRGGKPAGDELLKLVKPNSKRGKFLSYFMKGGGSRSIRECMAEFSITRSNALSYLHLIHKDHGIGYELIGDSANLLFPDGVTDPFNEPGDLDDF